MSAIVGPIAPYSNVPIQPQFYEPSRFVISAITLGVTTIVTTSINNNYVIGQLCRLLIPIGYGCRLLNEQLGYVISIPSLNQIELNVNSQFADPFINASLAAQPQIVAVGDVNYGTLNANGRMQILTSIPGSFINISP